MEYEIHKNGWSVICHTPIQNLKHTDILKVIKLLIQNTVVVWRNQSLSPQNIQNFCNYLGNHDYAFTTEEYENFSQKVKSSFVSGLSGLIRVSGKKDDHNNEGVFGHIEDLNWHSDKIHDIERKPFTFLYGASGSSGSVTHFTNHMIAYDLLSDDKKREYESLKIKFGLGRWRKDIDSFAYQKTKDQIGGLDPIEHNLIVENPYGKKGIFISPLQTEHVTGMTHSEMLEFCDDMLDHITSPSCVYSHYWKDGDVVLSDQIFGIHKRDKFEKMHERELHRMSFDLDNILPGMKYKGYKGKI